MNCDKDWTLSTRLRQPVFLVNVINESFFSNLGNDCHWSPKKYSAVRRLTPVYNKNTRTKCCRNGETMYLVNFCSILKYEIEVEKITITQHSFYMSNSASPNTSNSKKRLYYMRVCLNLRTNHS